MFNPSIINVLADGAAQGSPWGSFIIFIPLIGIMYFMMIRPQQKRQKQMQEMLRALKVGDKVYTTGGALGTIVKVTEQRVRLSFSERVEIEFVRSAIAGVIPETEETEAALAKTQSEQK